MYTRKYNYTPNWSSPKNQIVFNVTPKNCACVARTTNAQEPCQLHLLTEYDQKKKILEVGLVQMRYSDGNLVLVFGDRLFVDVLALKGVNDSYDYFDGWYERHCEEDQWICPWRACEEAGYH